MTLHQFLQDLGPGADRDQFVAATGSSLQYLRHVASGRKKPSVEMCVAIERANGKVTCEALRPDVDWHYLQCRGL